MPVPNQRITGLSRNALVPGLLGQLPAKPGQPSCPQSQEDILAPPEESDDESETLSDSSMSKAGKRADSSSGASNSDMAKVTFGASKSTSGRRKGAPLEKKEDSSDLEDDVDSKARQSRARSSLKRTRPSTAKPTDGSMDDLVSMFNRPRQTKNPGYGRKAMQTRTAPKRSRQLVVPDALSPSPERKRRGIILPPSHSPSPPRLLRVPSMSPPPERKVDITAAALFDSPPAKRHTDNPTVVKSEFDSSQPWSEVPDEDNESMSNLAFKSISSKAEETCPMCYQPVDRDLLREFSNGKILTMRQQMRFCNLHKSRSAKDTWAKRGYPCIDWNGLNRRLKRHHKVLRQIINGEESHFRKDLAAKLATGQERTLRKTERSLAPGYYGNRGLRLMSEHIIEHFSERLREKAVDDQVISGRGTTVFVSKVLVPELATRLIMEDMSVGIREAREILVESVDMGDLLQDDVADGDIDAADAVSDHHEHVSEED